MTAEVFAGLTAIVTGASRGIGLAIATDIVAHGGRVCLTARKQDELDAALAELPGDAAIAVAGNTSDATHREDAVRRTIDAFGSLDILVNNAATNVQYGALVDADLAAVEKILAVNYVAPIGWVQAVWHAWMAEHGGTILNVASVGGLQPAPLIGAYGGSKAALIHLTAQLAVELAPRVRVNAVAPAVVKTTFARALYEDREAEVAAGYPLGRLGVPQDVAHAARAFLAPGAGWITGQTLVLDGGASLGPGSR
ncbi:MAG: SDR family oxidoreductase [Actinobacteria bacterium]|nr:SDR family oxidoreductase [Actinomycetota bacterium]